MRRARRPSLAAVVCAALLLGGAASVIARALAGHGRPEPARPPQAIDAEGADDRFERGVPTRRRSPSAREREGAGDEQEPALAPAPGEAAGAGEPVAVAERFAAGWANRAGSVDALRAQRAELVSLSAGLWAREVNAEFAEAIDAGGEQARSRGSVLLSHPLRRSAAAADVLVVTRERALAAGEPVEPFHYATYLARLVAAPGGGYAVASWEPQY